MKKQRTYVVTWQHAAIVASSPREAAECAVDVLRNGATTFTVEWLRKRKGSGPGVPMHENVTLDVHEVRYAVAPASIRIPMTTAIVDTIADPRFTVWEQRSRATGAVRFRVWRDPQSSRLVLTDFRRPNDARNWRLFYTFRRLKSGRVLVHVEMPLFCAVPNSAIAEIEKAVALTEYAQAAAFSKR